jgi:hypothetical protein
VHFDILGPVSGPRGRIVTTLVRASGRGLSSDADRLEREVKDVANEGSDITIDLCKVDELGSGGIDALARLAALVASWPPCMLYILAERAGAVWDELRASELVRHARVDLVESGCS